jgi:hypothetical protein
MYQELLKKNASKLQALNLPEVGTTGEVLLLETHYIESVPGVVNVEMITPGSYPTIHGRYSAEILQMVGNPSKIYGFRYRDHGKEAIDFAIAHGIKVISASFHAIKSPEFEANLKRYYEWGGIYVSAAGNDPGEKIVFPARLPFTLAVSATNTPDCDGPEIDVTADSNWWVVVNGNWNTYGGTSCATPVIAGCVLRILKKYPDWNLDQVREFLRANSVPGTEPHEWVFRFPDNFEEVKEIIKEHIVIHHSATTDGIVYRDFDSIKAGHLARGFRDIGYHWVIESVNNKLVAIPGRAEWDIGAHCPGKNEDGIGVCVVGNFEKEVPSEELYQFVANKCKDVMSRHPIKSITGHYDHCPTLCPGKNFDVEKVKQLVYRKEETPLEKIKVKIGDKEVTGLLIQLPGEVNATTYVPIRAYNDAVVESLKAAVDEVIWHKEDRSVEVK